MNIKEALEDARACGNNVGLNSVIGNWSDEELIVFALNFLSANIEDAVYVPEEDDNVSN